MRSISLALGVPVSCSPVRPPASRPSGLPTTTWSLAGIENPWSIFLPRHARGGQRIQGTLLPDPVPGVPEVLAEGQGGLFDVVPHPDFASNRLLYLSYAKPNAEGSTTTVIRAR